MPPSASPTPHPLLVQTFRRMRRDARTDDSAAPVAVLAGINFVIDGGGSAITTGTVGGLIIPFPCRIRKVELQEMDGTAGTVTIDIQKAPTGSAPTFASICASTRPTIASSGRYYMDQSWAPTNGLVGWTTTINKGDALRYSVTAAATIQRITVALHVQRLDIAA